MKGPSSLKIPNCIDLGSVLPGHFSQKILTLLENQPTFLTLTLTSKSIANGFFLLKIGTSDCVDSLNVVLKPDKKTQILVGSYPKQVSVSTQMKGELIISQEGKQYRVKIKNRIQVPNVSSKKMLQDTQTNMKMVRLVVNKAVTSDVRIPLFNPEDYSMDFQVGLLVKSSIADKQNPFIIKTHANPVKAESKQQFFVFLNIQTNIGYKGDPKGMKKVAVRNVLTLKTNSSLIWCLPIELIIVFVKQPEFKTDD